MCGSFWASAFGISFVDISTGEFLTAEGTAEEIDKLLQNFAPNEILISKKHKTDFTETFGTKVPHLLSGRLDLSGRLCE